MNYKALTKKQLESIFDSVPFKTKPFLHQYACLAWAFQKDKVAFFLDIGTGKTLVALYCAMLWKCENILVVCPKPVMNTWGDQITEHTDFTYTIVDGNKEKRLQFLTEDTNVKIINYAGLKTVYADRIKLKDKTSYMLNREAINPVDLIIFDESHHLKNHKALQTKIAYNLSRVSKRAILLTGTPIEKDVKDLWSQYHVLDGGRTLGTSFFGFLKQYYYKGMFEWEPKKICPICGKSYTRLTSHIIATKEAKDIYEWRRKIKNLPKKSIRELILDRVVNCTMRYDKEECVDLPEIIYEQFYGDMTQEQRSFESKILQGLNIELEKGELTLSNVLNRSNKLAQVTGGFVIGTGGAERLKNNPKIDLLEEAISTIGEKQIIVYHSFVEEGRIIEELCRRKKYRFGSLRGEISQKDKTKALDKFKKGDIQILIAHPESGGEGLNLQFCQYMIFFSNTFSGRARQQSEGRIYRAGQNKSVLILDLLLKNSIDEYIYEALKSKKDLSESVLNYIKGNA